MSYLAAVVLVQEPDEAMAYATLITLLQVTRLSCGSRRYTSRVTHWNFGVNKVVAKIHAGANGVRDLDNQVRPVFGI